MIKLVFTPTEDDLRAAYRLHMHRSGWKRFGYFVLFGAAIGVAIAAVDGFPNVTTVIGVVLGMTIWAAVVALLFQFAVPKFWIPRLARKIFLQQKDLQLENETWWDDNQLHSRNAQAHAYLNFSDIVKWRRDDKILLLYRSDHLFNFLPMRVFSDRSLPDALIRRLQDAGVPSE